MFSPTPTAGVKALRLGNDRPTASSAEVSGPEGRKRRRITPTNTVPAPTSNDGPHPSTSAQPEIWSHLLKWQTEDDEIVGSDDDDEEEDDDSDVGDEILGAEEVTVDVGDGEDNLPGTVPVPRT